MSQHGMHMPLCKLQDIFSTSEVKVTQATPFMYLYLILVGTTIILNVR